MQASDFALMLDASDGESITTAGGAVSEWADISGNGRDYTQAGADTIKPTWDGSEELLFDVTDGIEYLHNPSPVIPQTTDWVLSCRVRPTSVAGNINFLSQYTQDIFNGRLLLRALSGVPQLFLGNDAASSPSVAMSGGSLTAGVAATLTGTRIGNRFALRVDGVEVASRVDTTTRQIQQVGNVLAARGSGAGYLDGITEGFSGGIERVGVFHGTADADDIEAIERYMQYGFTRGIPLPLLQGMI